MKDALIIFLIGIASCAASFLLKKREARLFENAVPATATVVFYDEYTNMDNSERPPVKMYTAVMEYALADGTKMQAREQCGRSRKKYPIGTQLPIQYSAQEPGLFIIEGDHSRPFAFFAVFVMGLLMVALAVALYLTETGA